MKTNDMVVYDVTGCIVQATELTVSLWNTLFSSYTHRSIIKVSLRNITEHNDVQFLCTVISLLPFCQYMPWTVVTAPSQKHLVTEIKAYCIRSKLAISTSREERSRFQCDDNHIYNKQKGNITVLHPVLKVRSPPQLSQDNNNDISVAYLMLNKNQNMINL